MLIFTMIFNINYSTYIYDMIYYTYYYY